MSVLGVEAVSPPGWSHSWPLLQLKVVMYLLGENRFQHQLLLTQGDHQVGRRHTAMAERVGSNNKSETGDRPKSSRSDEAEAAAQRVGPMRK